MVPSIARLAWRNLWRHARRTQLLLAVVAYATVAIIFFWGFFDGFVDTMISSQARFLDAPGQVVLGIDLAAAIDVRVGERLVIDAQSQAGSQALGLVVVGPIDADLVSVDETVVWIQIEDARALTGVWTATSLAALGPARLAATIEPTEAMRYTV